MEQDKQNKNKHTKREKFKNLSQTLEYCLTTTLSYDLHLYNENIRITSKKEESCRALIASIVSQNNTPRSYLYL